MKRASARNDVAGLFCIMGMLGRSPPGDTSRCGCQRATHPVPGPFVMDSAFQLASLRWLARPVKLPLRKETRCEVYFSLARYVRCFVCLASFSQCTGSRNRNSVQVGVFGDFKAS